MTPNEIISERLDRIETIPDKFINGVVKIQSEIYAELLTLLSELGVNKSFKLTSENLIRIDTIMQQYYTVLENGKYGSYVSWFIDEMKRQQTLNDDFFKAEFAATVSNVSKAVYQSARERAVRQLLGDDFKTNFINIVKDQIIGSLQGQADFTELKDDLFGLFNETTIEPQMARWVKQISSDTFAQADRAYSESIAREIGASFGIYAGGLIRDSRQFCVDREGDYFHINEVRDWASLTWQGKFRNTNEQNMPTVLGGYNCQHVFAYRSLINIPREVLIRNIENGNYEPDEAEKSLLNL